MSNFNGFKERFNSSEDAPEWNEGAFDDGFKARMDEHSIFTCPTIDQTSLHYVRSWNAGWTEADAQIANGDFERFKESLNKVETAA